MKFKRRTKSARVLTQFDIVPLVDVVFLVVSCFVLSSFFTMSTAIRVKLPNLVTSGTVKEDNFIIAISSENVIYLNNQIFTIKELEKELTVKKLNDRPFLIKSDRRASVGRIVDIWNLCRKVGIEKINIATAQNP